MRMIQEICVSSERVIQESKAKNDDYSSKLPVRRSDGEFSAENVWFLPPNSLKDTEKCEPVGSDIGMGATLDGISFEPVRGEDFCGNGVPGQDIRRPENNDDEDRVQLMREMRSSLHNMNELLLSVVKK
jgi:hypothetical protein